MHGDRRLVVALALLPACLVTSGDNDGTWSPTTKPCVRLGMTPQVLASDPGLEHFVVGGDTVLFASGESIVQVPVSGGDRVLATDRYRQGRFGLIDEALVPCDVIQGAATDVVLDRGNSAPQRFETLSTSASAEVVDLTVIPAGVYWRRGSQPGWRWEPSGEVTEYDLRASSWVETDGTDFLYALDNDTLVTQPVIGGGPRQVVTSGVVAPAAITAAELFYLRGNDGNPASSDSQLIAQSRTTGVERFVAGGFPRRNGAIAAGYYYWVDGDAIGTLLRVPVEGGQVAPVFVGGVESLVHQIAIDDCNVYWTQLSFEINVLYARGHD
jgi:hypothetical protein